MKNHVKTVSIRAVQFAELTKGFIRNGQISRAKKCLDMAELLFKNGNSETRSAIGNIYVSSVSTFMEIRNCSIAKLFPPMLKQEYVMQVNTSGV